MAYDLKQFSAKTGQLIKEDGTTTNVADILADVYDPGTNSLKTTSSSGSTNLQVEDADVTQQNPIPVQFVEALKGDPATSSLSGTAANATSTEIDARGYNAVLVDVDFTTGASTGYFTISVLGSFSSGGTFKACYDNQNNKLSTPSITNDRIQLFVGIPDYIKLDAVEDVDGGIITVSYQLLNV